LLCGARPSVAGHKQHGHLAANQIGRERWKSIELTLGKAVFDGHVLAFDVTGFLEALQKRGDLLAQRFARSSAQEADHGLCALLRGRRERPRCRRAAEQRDDLAPFHSITSSASSRRRPRERSAAQLSRARGGDFSVCAMLLLIAAIGTTRMACDEGRQAFTPPRGPFSLHQLVAPAPIGPPSHWIFKGFVQMARRQRAERWAEYRRQRDEAERRQRVTVITEFAAGDPEATMGSASV
jgi:hypothetical protein